MADQVISFVFDFDGRLRDQTVRLYSLVYFIEIFLFEQQKKNGKPKEKRIGCAGKADAGKTDGGDVYELYKRIRPQKHEKSRFDYDETAVSSPDFYDLFFLGDYPKKEAGKHGAIHEGEHLDYNRYEGIVKQTVALVKQGGYCVTPLDMYRDEQHKKLAEVWERCGLFLRLIVKINDRSFFILQKAGDRKFGKYAIVELFSVSSIGENFFGGDANGSDTPEARLTTEPKIIEKAMRNAYEAKGRKNEIDSDLRVAQGFRVDTARVFHIDSEIRYQGSVEEVKRIQDEIDAERLKRHWDFKHYQCYKRSTVQMLKKEPGGKVLIERPLAYDPKKPYLIIDTTRPCLYVPKTAALFETLGATVDLQTMYRTACELGLPYSAFDLNGIKWYEHCRKADNESYIDEVLSNRKSVLKPWEKLGQGPWMIEIDSDGMRNCVYTDEWFKEPGYYPALLGLPTAVLLEKDDFEKDGEDGIYSWTENGKYEPVQLLSGFDATGADYSPFQKIVAEIIKANLWMLRLNTEIVSKDFFALFLETPLGEKFLREWKERAKTEGVLPALEQLYVYLPQIERQRELLEFYDLEKGEAEAKQIEFEKIQSKIKAFIGGSERFYPLSPDLEKQIRNAPDPMRVLLEHLPQPLAAILHLDFCETNITKKIANLIHFLEAAAIFHASVMISVLYFYDKEKRINYSKLIFGNKLDRKRLTENGYLSINFEFGTWTHMGIEILNKDSKKSYVQIGDNQEQERLKFQKYFCTADNQELLKLLDEGREFRNEQYAHAERKTEIAEQELYNRLRNLAIKTEEKLASVYSRIGLYYNAKIESDGIGIDGRRKFDFLQGYVFSGISPRLEYSSRTEVEKGTMLPQSVSRIHILLDGELIPMLPFVVAGPLAPKDSGLLCTYYLYFITVTRNPEGDADAKWHSFDCGECPEFPSKVSCQKLLKAKHLLELAGQILELPDCGECHHLVDETMEQKTMKTRQFSALAGHIVELFDCGECPDVSDESSKQQSFAAKELADLMRPSVS